MGIADAIGIIGGAESGAAGIMGFSLKATAYLDDFFAILAGIALYIIMSIGVQCVARRRRIRNSWLAWVPIANLWVLGSISDQYQYLVKGRIKSRRWGLVILAVLTIAAYIAGAYCVYLSTYKGHMNSTVFALPMLLAFVLVVLFGAGVVIVAVQLYMCCYDLFRSCDPDNRKLFLVLSILYPIGLSFIVLAIRKRDGGMPPKKQPAPIVEESIEEPTETEEEKPEGEPEDEQEEPVADA